MRVEAATPAAGQLTGATNETKQAHNSTDVPLLGNLSPDLAMADEFLSWLGAFETKFTFQTFADTPDAKAEDKQRKKANRKLKYAEVLHGTLEQHAAELKRLNNAGAGVFVTVNETDLKGRKEENITRVRAAFADTDGAPLEPIQAFKLPSSGIVESSPQSWHAYWLCSDLPKEQFKGVQWKIAELFKSDKAVNDLPRVMRLPGFWHVKEKPFMVRIVGELCHNEYTADEILSAFPPLSETPKHKIARTNEIADTRQPELNEQKTEATTQPLPRHKAVVNSLSSRVQIQLLDGVPEGRRSDAIYGVAKDLIKEGITDNEIAEILTEPTYALSAKAYECGRNDRHKAKQWTMTYTLKNARADVAREIKVLTDASPPPDITDSSIITLPDYPSELLDLPYHLGDLQQFIYNRMTYQSLPMAGITAMATLTAFAQTHVTINSRDGLGLNEYYMILAPTGFGKEDIRKPMELLDTHSDMTTTAIMANAESVKFRHAAPASAQGIHQILEDDRSTCFLSDEFAEWLRLSHSDAQKQAGLGYLMQCYTKALGTIEPGHAVTRKYEPVTNPRLTIFATSTAEAMFQTLTRDQADSGAYNRWVMFAGDTELPQKRYRGQVYTPDDSLVDFIAWAKAIQPKTEIDFSDDGYEAFIHLDDTLAEPIKRTDGVLGGRLSEQAIKMAALIALSAKRFTIERADLETAFNIRIGLYKRAEVLARHEGSMDGLHATGQALKQLTEQFYKRPAIYRSQLKSLSRRYAALSVHEQKAVIEALICEGVAHLDHERPSVLRSLVHEI